jgi:hypothetical protein
MTSPTSASASPNASGLGLPSIQHLAENRYSVQIGGRTMIATVNDPQLKQGKPAEIQQLLQQILSHQKIAEEVEKGLDEYHIDVPFSGTGTGSIESTEAGHTTKTALQFKPELMAKLRTIYQSCMRDLNTAMASFSLIRTPPPTTAALATAAAASDLTSRTRNVSIDLFARPQHGGASGISTPPPYLGAAVAAAADPLEVSAAAARDTPEALAKEAEGLSDQIKSIKDDNRDLFPALYEAWTSLQSLKIRGLDSGLTESLNKELVAKLEPYSKIRSAEFDVVDLKALVDNIKDPSKHDEIRQVLSKLLLRASINGDKDAQKQITDIFNQISSVFSTDSTLAANWNQLFQKSENFRNMWNDFTTKSLGLEATSKPSQTATVEADVKTKAAGRAHSYTSEQLTKRANEIEADITKMTADKPAIAALVLLRIKKLQADAVPSENNAKVIARLEKLCRDKIEEHGSNKLNATELDWINGTTADIDKRLNVMVKSNSKRYIKDILAKYSVMTSGGDPVDDQPNGKTINDLQNAKIFIEHIQKLLHSDEDFTKNWNAFLEADKRVAYIWNSLNLK